MSLDKPEQMNRRATFLAAGALVGAIAIALFVVFRTVRDLAVTRDAAGIASALGRLLLISLAAGVVASMILEFAKRIGPLRTAFHRRQVLRWFGFECDGLFGAPLAFGAPLEILTAQLAVLFRSNPHAVAGPLGDEIRRRTADASAVEGDSAQLFDLAIESLLDSFHVATRARWTQLMRLASSGIAAALAGFAAAAANSRISVVIGLAAAGLVIGGPFAWTTRDVVRIIERRSSP